MITYAAARQLVIDALGPVWPGPGTFHADENGWEDALGFSVPVGPREWLVDGDYDYMILDDYIVLVDRSLGTIVESSAIKQEERLAAMTPVSV